MNDSIKDFLKECDCDSDYETCLKYLQECNPTLDIECIYSDDCYLTSKEDMIRLAKECLKNRKKDNG